MSNESNPPSDPTDRFVAWYAAMGEAQERLTEEQRRDLNEWARANPDGQVGTSGWPGWEAIIGPPPWRSGTANGQESE